MNGTAGEFRRRLLAWYVRHRRDLPWRVPPDAPAGSRPDAYAVLVSEAMLQQTQVATVVDYFRRFMDRFPTVASLAAADEQDVLRLWQGLGYYSRARNLRRAAAEIVARYDGRVPADVDALLALPGVGRYTAGAVASLAYDVRAPILDGNVTRVLCRIDGVIEDPRDRSVQARLWSRAAELASTKRAGDLNSALMELGAIICTPRAPKCLLCPVRPHCVAADRGIAEEIPPPRKARPTPLERRVVLCLVSGPPDAPMTLLEQRPATGRWAGLWQWITIPAPANGDPADWEALRLQIGRFTPPRAVARLRHQLTHRRYEFEVFAADCARPKPATAPRRWIPWKDLGSFPLPKPHVMIADSLSPKAAR